MKNTSIDNTTREKTAAELNSVLDGRAKADQLTCAQYSTDASIYCIEPLCVVFPHSERDVETTVRYAHERGLTVIPRGGGSGLAGETLGRGIVMDMSGLMNRVIDTNRDANTVTVQPGVVLEQLNRQLAAIGKQFGPDPASGNRATIGGMIGNNATGAHSMKYGYTGDHILSLKMVTADAISGTLDAGGTIQFPDSESSPLDRFDSIRNLLQDNCDLLRESRPQSDRNGSGYNVYAALDDDRYNPCQLLAGAEGTLGIVTEVTLNLVERPCVKVILQSNYDSLAKMARAVPYILEHQPSACELMDGHLLGLARDAFPQYHDVLPGGVAASLVIEFDGSDEAAVIAKMQSAHKMVRSLPPDAACMGTQEIIAPALQERIWQARKAGVPLLFRNKSSVQPIPVIEDVAVNPDQLAQYLEGMEAITKRLGIPVAYYAHAGHGELHPRPYLDLHQPDGVRKLRQLAEEVFKLTWSLGGTISGEHGEGLVRVSFIKEQYGEETYELFRTLKNTLDPNGTLNPGKIVNDDPDIMTKNLRFSQSSVRENYRTEQLFRNDELIREIEQCNGNGLCRSADPKLSMCPIFRVTGDEDASPRAKGNLMRFWLYGQLDEKILQTDEFKRIADLCVNCKMCAIQCPSLVNIPKLMVEARAAHVRAHGLNRTQWALTRSNMMSRMGALFGPVANTFLQAGWFRIIMEKALGFDRRRPFPRFARGSNLKKLRRYLQQQKPIVNPRDKVVYFIDLYANYNDHELGRAVIDVLHHNRIEVILPEQRDAGMPALSYGAIDYARRIMQYNVNHLAAKVRDGYKVVCSEPTAALCLKEEYLDVLDTEDAHLLARNTCELTDYLARRLDDGQLETDFNSVPITLAYHEPCHYSALKIEKGSRHLLAQIPDLTIDELPNSCCGIAGTFGFQKKNFDMSVRAGDPMLKPLRESTAQYGLTECGTCKMQMELIGEKKIFHPIKILAAALGYLDLN